MIINQETKKYFEENKYVVIKNFLSTEMSILAYQYCVNKVISIDFKKFYDLQNYHKEWDGNFNDTQSPNEMLVVTDGQYPILLKEVMHSNIAVETLVILNDIMNFFPMWDKKIADTIVWPSMRRKFVKYTPFIDYDKSKFTAILKECLKEYA